MSDLKLEQRVAALERAVANIQAWLAAAPAAGNWLEKITGTITDQEAFREMLELGRAFREADRPPDEPGEPS
jgi:hypothetical protein